MRFYRNKRLLYLMVFFHNLIPAYVIERLFWQERGMTVQMVVWCEFIYAGTIVALEIPSGVLADLFGRRRLVLLSAVFPCLEFFLLIYSTEFWHFAAVVFMAGIAKTMYSGAQNALLYESLDAAGKADEFERTVGRTNALDFTAATIAGLSGGFLAHRFGLEFNYWLSLVSSVIALACAAALREPPRLRSEDGQRPPAVREIAVRALSFFKARRDVLRIALNASLVAAATVYLDEFWQIYLDDRSFPLALFGLAAACLSLARIPGAMLADKLLRFMRHGAAVWICTLFFGGFALLAAIFGAWYGIFAIAAAMTLSAAIEPLALGYLHHRADDRARATIESAMSLLERVFAIAIGLLFGFIAARSGVSDGFLAIGLAACAAGTAFGIAWRCRGEAA